MIQTRFTPANIAAAAAPLLDDDDLREEQIRAQDEALALMGRGGTPAAEIAADAVLKVMKNGGPVAGSRRFFVQPPRLSALRASTSSTDRAGR